MTAARRATTILTSLTGSWTMARRWRKTASSRRQEPKRIIKDTMSTTKIPSHRCDFELPKRLKVDSFFENFPGAHDFTNSSNSTVERPENCSEIILERDAEFWHNAQIQQQRWDFTGFFLLVKTMVKCSGVGDYRGAAENQIPTESSGYHSGSLSKSHKSNSGEMSWNLSSTVFPSQYFTQNNGKLKADYFKVLWSFVHNNFLRGMIHQNHVQHASDHD